MVNEPFLSLSLLLIDIIIVIVLIGHYSDGGVHAWFRQDFLMQKFLSSSLGEVGCEGLVDLLDQRVDQVEHVDGHVDSHEVEEIVRQAVPQLRIRHKSRKLEHGPDAGEHRKLIKYLDCVSPGVVVGLHKNEVDDETGAQDIRQEDLKHERSAAHHDDGCEEETA